MRFISGDQENKVAPARASRFVWPLSSHVVLIIPGNPCRCTERERERYRYRGIAIFIDNPSKL